MTGNENKDFASATMLRLVHAGLEMQGISIDQPRSTTAHVPRGTKRDLLQSILEAHGPMTVVSIAEAAESLAPEPVVQALRNASSLADLLDRWQRLEKFSHARHRVRMECAGPDKYHLTHENKAGGPPPSPAESLLVVAVITRLAELIGAKNVTLATKAGEMLRAGKTWSALKSHRSLGTLVLTAKRQGDTDKMAPPQSNPDDLARLRDIVRTDPVRRWSLKDAAGLQRTSVRTLQRRLSHDGTSFSRLISETRLEVAAQYLCAPGGPDLSEIGYLSGYSDQAHFSRSFQKAVGLSPKRYRADFQTR